MFGINYDTHAIHGLLCHEFEDSDRWEVTSYFEDDYKRIKLVWHTSKTLYRYLFLHQVPHTPMFVIRKGDSHWRVKAYTSFLEDSHSIQILWKVRTDNELSCSDVNASKDILTAQHIYLKLRLPFMNGLVNHTQNSFAYGRRGKERSGSIRTAGDYDHPTYPLWHSYILNCYVSGDRGIYARASAENPLDRVIVPLKCYHSPHKFYKAFNRGEYVIYIDNQRYSVWPGTWQHLCEVNRSHFRRDFPVLMIDGYIYLHDLRIFDSTTNQYVHPQDIIKLYHNYTLSN